MDFKTVWDTVKTQLIDFWNKSKVIIVAVLSLLAVLKFRDFFIDLLVSSSKRIGEDAKKQNTALGQEEQKANTQANQLVQHAQHISENKPNVDDDWYKQ